MKYGILYEFYLSYSSLVIGLGDVTFYYAPRETANETGSVVCLILLIPTKETNLLFI